MIPLGELNAANSVRSKLAGFLEQKA